MNRFVQAVGTIALTVCLTIAVRQVSGEEAAVKDAPVFAPAAQIDNSQSDKIQADVPDDAVVHIEKLLRTPVTIKFDDVSLATALLQLIDTYHLPITPKSRRLIPQFDARRSGEPNPEDSIFRITVEYQRKPLRVVLNELTSIGRMLKMYWIHSNGTIEIGSLNESDKLQLLNTPVIRVYDVSSLVPLDDVPTTTDKPHPLVKAALDAALTNGISIAVGDTPTNGASAYEPAATLMRNRDKAILVVRHNTLAHHEIENFLGQLLDIAVK